MFQYNKKLNDNDIYTNRPETTSLNNNNNNNNDYDCLPNCVALCCKGLLGIFACGAGITAIGLILGLALFNIVLHIVSLVYIEKYKNDMYCDNDIISPYTWMLVYSIVGICGGVFSFGENKYYNFIIYAFLLAWLIVGSVMFWGTCEDAGMPKSINTLFYINLISGFIMVCGVFDNNKKEKKSNNKNNNNIDNNNNIENDNDIEKKNNFVLIIILNFIYLLGLENKSTVILSLIL